METKGKPPDLSFLLPLSFFSLLHSNQNNLEEEK